jgi:integrase
MTDKHALVPRPDLPRVELAIAAWLHAKGGRSGSRETRVAYTATLASFRAALQAAGLDLDGDVPAIALAAQAWAAEGGPAAATFNRRLAILSSFYRYAQAHDLLAMGNPIARIDRRPVESYATAEPLPVAEARRRLADIPHGPEAALVDRRDHVLITVALLTCRRLSELAALRRRDLRLNMDGTVTLSFGRTKGGKVARDTLPRAASKALLGYLHAAHGASPGDLASDAPIWVSASRQNPGEALSPSSLKTIAHRRMGVHFHALRHTGAALLEAQGAKVSEIQARLGHTSLATTGRYLAKLARDHNPYGEGIAAALGLEDIG